MEIQYEDREIIVCCKPAGLATETSRIGQQDMVSLLRNGRAAKGEPPYIGTVHRLDQPVEGLMVFAKTKSAAAELSRQVAGRSIRKYYCALGLCGTDAQEDAKKLWQDGANEWVTLTDYIYFDKKKNLSVIADKGTPQAKKAQLRARRLGQQDGRVCFDIELETGRHHQIRVMMARRGFPLVGDFKYGPGAAEAVRDTCTSTLGDAPGARAPQLALCAYRLTFVHPATKEEMDFCIRPDNDAFSPFAELFKASVPARTR